MPRPSDGGETHGGYGCVCRRPVPMAHELAAGVLTRERLGRVRRRTWQQSRLSTSTGRVFRSDPRDLKAELDQVIFGRPMAASRVAHYSDVRWPPAGPVGGRSSGAAADRAARDRAVRAAAKPQVAPTDAASEIVAATLAPARLGGDVVHRLQGGRAQPEPASSVGPSATDTRRGSATRGAALPISRSRRRTVRGADTTGWRHHISGLDLPPRRRCLCQRRGGLPVRRLRRTDACPGPSGAPHRSRTESHRRPQPGHDHRVRRPQRTGLLGLQRGTARHAWFAARHRQRPGSAPQSRRSPSTPSPAQSGPG